MSLFDTVSENKSDIKNFFQSNEWKTIELEEKLKTLEKFFDITAWTNTRSDIKLDILREIELIKSTLSKRPCVPIIPNYKIYCGVYTDYNSIYINFDYFVQINNKHVETLYMFYKEQCRLLDYNNVINNKTDNRTNEIRLNLATPKLYFQRDFSIRLTDFKHNPSLRPYQSTFLFHNCQPIESYAREDALKEINEVFKRLNLYNGDYIYFLRGQKRFEYILNEELNMLGITKDDVKRRIMDAAIYYLMARDNKTKEEILQKYCATDFDPQITKKIC